MQSQSTNQEQSCQDKIEESVTFQDKVAECSSIGYLDRGTGKHQSNMVYDANGIMPTQYAVQYKEPFKVVVDE